MVKFHFLLTCFFHFHNHTQGSVWNDLHSKIGTDMKNFRCFILGLIFFSSPRVFMPTRSTGLSPAAASRFRLRDFPTIRQSSSTAISTGTRSTSPAGNYRLRVQRRGGREFCGAESFNANYGSSTIAGSLSSTLGHLGPVGGTVLLLNPAGVLFTPTATVNVGSLTASTLGLPNQNDFLNGTALHFSGMSTAGVTVQNGQASILSAIFF